jgi:hypothetical protein
MKKSSWWFLVALVLQAVTGAGAAVAQVTSAQVKSTPVPADKPLTAEALRAQPVDLSRMPRLLAMAAVPNSPPDWNGPDLQPKPPLGFTGGSSAQAGCTNFPYASGWMLPWRVINVGKAPYSGPIKIHLTCEVVNMPASAPSDYKQELERRLCGCQRKDFTWPPAPPLLPGTETMMPVTSVFVGNLGPCNASPHPRVTAKVDPFGEGPATGNNTLVYDICM